MEIGIFARTFTDSTLDGVLDKIVDHDLRSVHFNLKCAGVESLPEVIDDTLVQSIRAAFAQRRLVMAGVSGTFNAIHPDPAVRARDIRRTQHLITRCPQLGTNLVTLCSGSRDPVDMWRYHAENESPAAWSDLRATLEQLLPLAEAHDVWLGLEPEQNNVLNSAGKARRLLDEMGSKQLRIIMDGANLFWPDELADMDSVLAQAFDLLGPDIVVAHAKEIPGADKQPVIGTGRLDWDTYFRLLKQSNFGGPIILHNLTESQVAASVAFIQGQLARWNHS